MNDNPSQYALREVRRYFTTLRFTVGLGAVALLLAVSGPFGTLTSMGFAPRLAYWAFTVPLTFGLGGFVSAYVSERLRSARPTWLAPLAVALSTSVSVTMLVMALNWAAFGMRPREHLAELIISVLVTAAIVALVLHFFSNHTPQSAAKGPTDSPPALLQRLELAKRGPLVSLSVQDHYVEVVTTKGTSLILMRLSDAIRETGTDTGMQVHRSHWVALPQVASITREGDKARITLSDGRDIPASRSYIPALKDAGLLPR